MSARVETPPLDSERVQRVTSAAAIYKHLYGAILSMTLPPGTALQDKVLCAEFSVSRTPVREALIRLAEDELVDIFPQSGTFVSRIKAAAIPEALDIRQALESLTARRATKRCAPADLQRLDAILDTQIDLAGKGDTSGFHEADELFHKALGDISGNRGIWRLVRQVKVQIDRTRRLTLPVPGRMLQVVTEHRAICHAMADGDPASAQAAMERHLAVLLPDLAHLCREYPTYFA